MGDVIHVISATDDNYAQHLGVLICSIFENNKSNPIDMHIIDGGIHPANKAKLLKLAQVYHRDLSFHKIDPSLYSRFSTYPTHLSPAAYYRLSIPDLLPKNVSKILYLDCDIVVIKNLKDLWKTDLKDYFVGAVVDDGMMTLSQYTGYLFTSIYEKGAKGVSGFKKSLAIYNNSAQKKIPLLDSDVKTALAKVGVGTYCAIKSQDGGVYTLKRDKNSISLYDFSNSFFTRLGIPTSCKYFNTGVLLMNLKKWRKFHVCRKTVEFLQKNKDARFMDQDALNGVLYNKWLELPGKYNVQCDSGINESPEAVVIHYLCVFKPWYFLASFPYSRHYAKYLALTPWKGSKPRLTREHLAYVNYLIKRHLPFVSVLNPLKKKLVGLIPK